MAGKSRLHTSLSDRSNGRDPSQRVTVPRREGHYRHLIPCPGSINAKRSVPKTPKAQKISRPLFSIKTSAPVLSIHPPSRLLRRPPHRFLGFRRLLHRTPRTSASPAGRALCSPPTPREMGYGDAAPPASAATARDAKKKRGNRTAAKLKQSKLETRRGQWLSQVQGKDGKDPKIAAAPTGAGAGSNAGSPILASPHPPLPRRRADARSRGSDPEDREEAVAAGLDVGSSDLDSPINSPGSNNSQSDGCPLRKGCSGHDGGPSLSSGSSVWSSSRSVSDAEEDDTGCPEDDSGVLDDWEAVADALSVDDGHCHQSPGPTMPPAPQTNVTPANAAKPELIPSKTRAWAPDDIFRPQSLPSISKQASFPASIGNCWAGLGLSATQQGILSLPLSCPICYEDLDPTDSSFLPCPCGFHLCLFCHKRILEADGRCPGCRKQYNNVSAAGSGGDNVAATAVGIGREVANVASMRLSRSCSMGPRY